MTNEELMDALYEKMCNEFNSYKEMLLELPADEILDHAYAYNAKQDILFAVEEMNLSDKQCTALLSEKNTLETIFERWVDLESYHMNDVRDNIVYTANERIRELYQNKLQDSR